ncbi:hypothetical protein HDU98_004279 [Podochytrium sp. JEL0797]|nr:hypothetical protein HDU98_004279 [Podochytrium sp. JEL0797]
MLTWVQPVGPNGASQPQMATAGQNRIVEAQKNIPVDPKVQQAAYLAKYGRTDDLHAYRARHDRKGKGPSTATVHPTMLQQFPGYYDANGGYHFYNRTTAAMSSNAFSGLFIAQLSPSTVQYTVIIDSSAVTSLNTARAAFTSGNAAICADQGTMCVGGLPVNPQAVSATVSVGSQTWSLSGSLLAPTTSAVATSTARTSTKTSSTTSVAPSTSAAATSFATSSSAEITSTATPSPTPTAAASNSGGGNSNNNAIIIGASAGGGALILLGIIAYFLIQRNNRHKRRENSQHAPWNQPTTPPVVPVKNAAFNAAPPTSLELLQQTPTQSRFESGNTSSVVGYSQYAPADVNGQPVYVQQYAPSGINIQPMYAPQQYAAPVDPPVGYSPQAAYDTNYAAPAAGQQYPGYYDQQGNYHFYTAEQLQQQYR